MDALSQVLFGSVCAIILIRFVHLTLKGAPARGLISALACVMYIVCLFVSAHMQILGLSSTKLLPSSILPPTQAAEIGALSLRWSLELFFILTGEVIAGFLAPTRRRNKNDAGPNDKDSYLNFVSRQASLVLVAVGIISTIVFQSDLSSRADEGQGLFTILKTFLVVGLCLIAFNDFFGRRLYYYVFAVGAVIIIVGAVRSPIFSVAIAYFAGRIARGELSTSALVRFAAIGFTLAVLGTTMSYIRGDVIAGRAADPLAALAKAAENPFIAIYAGGVDTLDGYRLSQLVQPLESARPANVFVSVTTFVPRALWPSKPHDLSLDITQRYLGWKQGGMFLSIVGYLSIAFGGYYQAVAALFVLAIILSYTYRKNFRNFYGFIALLITFRLFLGGGPFDVYFGLVYAAIFALTHYAVMKLGKGYYAKRRNSLSMPQA